MSELMFQIGDFIKNKKPYDGEHEYLIKEIKDGRYRCAWMKGKHVSEPDFDNLYSLPFEDAHLYYHKVG